MTSLQKYLEKRKEIDEMWNEDAENMQKMNDEIGAILDKYYDKLNIKDNEENFFLTFYKGLEENRETLKEWEEEDKVDEDDERSDFEEYSSEDYRQRYRDLAI